MKSLLDANSSFNETFLSNQNSTSQLGSYGDNSIIKEDLSSVVFSIAAFSSLLSNILSSRLSYEQLETLNDNQGKVAAASLLLVMAAGAASIYYNTNDNRDVSQSFVLFAAALSGPFINFAAKAIKKGYEKIPENCFKPSSSKSAVGYRNMENTVNL